MGITETDIEKYGPLDKYPTCVCPLCDRTEQDCCCGRDDVFKASSIAWQRDYDQIQQLRAELEVEREALREICEVSVGHYACSTDCIECKYPCQPRAHIERLEKLKC